MSEEMADGGAAGAVDAKRQAATLACPLTPGTGLIGRQSDLSRV
jgi:hypothetical protein